MRRVTQRRGVRGLGLLYGTSRQAVPHAIRRFLRDAGGGPVVEFAFVLPLMVLFVLGLVELHSYMDVKERFQKAVNQAASVASTIPVNAVTNRTDLTNELTNIANSMQNVLAPYGGHFTMRFCDGTTQPIAVVRRTFLAPCGAQGGPTPTLPQELGGGCGNSQVAYGQFVSVAVSCRYTPFFVNFGLFDTGVTVEAQSTAHMRQTLDY